MCNIIIQSSCFLIGRREEEDSSYRSVYCNLIALLSVVVVVIVTETMIMWNRWLKGSNRAMMSTQTFVVHFPHIVQWCKHWSKHWSNWTWVNFVSLLSLFSPSLLPLGFGIVNFRSLTHFDWLSFSCNLAFCLEFVCPSETVCRNQFGNKCWRKCVV